MGNTLVRDYDLLAREGLSHAEIGATALRKAAAALSECIPAHPASPIEGGEERLMEALQRNQRLWTILQVECNSPECNLDDGVRRNLLQLSHYVDRATFKCIAQPDRMALEGLVRINEELAKGLAAAAREILRENPQPEARALSFSF